MADDDQPLMEDMNKPDNQTLTPKKAPKKKRLCAYCCKKSDNTVDDEDEDAKVQSRAEVNRVFCEQQTFELWVIFIIKLFTSMIFVIDDLTFLLYCQYEYGMSTSEAGVLFCVSAVCLFTYGLTITGFLIDKTGVKNSLLIGLSLYAIAKFLLVFTDARWQVYLIMTTIMPLGISIIFPGLILGVKKLTFENARPMAFSFFFGAMIVGAIFGGPVIDWIRHDYKTTTWHYSHYNPELDREEDRT